MKLSLVTISKKDKIILSSMLFDYQSELLSINNPGPYKYIDTYWSDNKRTPLFIKVDGKIVGFVLINKHTLVVKDGHNVAEFFIKKEFRKVGLGKIAAIEVFNMFPGEWEVREMKENIDALNFWRKVICDYTNGDYSEIILNNELWNGSVQTFKSYSQ